MATKIEHARLAAAINIIRPEWPTASLQTLLDRDHAARPFGDLAVALVAVAVDPASTTPARLKEAGPWWRLAHEEPTPTPPPVAAILETYDAADTAEGVARCRAAIGRQT